MNEGRKNELKNEALEKVSGGNPPELPATNLSGSSYEGMFAPCDPLKPAPELPATQLGENCYSGMFAPCEPIEPENRDLLPLP